MRIFVPAGLVNEIAAGHLQFFAAVPIIRGKRPGKRSGLA